MKKILFGVLFVVFLMLMTPVNSAFESDIIENNQNLNNIDILEKRFLMTLNLFLRNIKDAIPDVYNEFNDEINGYINGINMSDVCGMLYHIWGYSVLFILFIFFPGTIIALLIAAVSFLLASVLGCEWVDDPEWPWP
jgi:hypothetical protein